MTRGQQLSLSPPTPCLPYWTAAGPRRAPAATRADGLQESASAAYTRERSRTPNAALALAAARAWLATLSLLRQPTPLSTPTWESHTLISRELIAIAF